jgi:hypothetical protein
MCVCVDKLKEMEMTVISDEQRLSVRNEQKSNYLSLAH